MLARRAVSWADPGRDSRPGDAESASDRPV